MDSSQPLPESRAGRLEFIDMMRAAAALLVVLFHTVTAYQRAGWGSSPVEDFVTTLLVNFFDLGKIGVVVFFVVSGFVIPSSLKEGRRKPLLTFLISRVARLYPAYWLSIVLAVAAYYYAGLPVPDIRELAINLTMFQQFVHVDNVISVFWTLQIELIFYFLAAVLFAVGILKDRRSNEGIAWGMLLVAVLMAVVRWKTMSKLPVALPLALCFMFLGSLLRPAMLTSDTAARQAAIRVSIGIVMAMPAISLLAYNRDMGFGERWYTYTLSYYTALGFVWLAMIFPRAYPRWVTWLGEVSYASYLLHYLIIAVVMASCEAWGLQPIAQLPLVAIVMGLTILASSLCFILVEKPCVLLGRRLMDRLEADHEPGKSAPSHAAP